VSAQEDGRSLPVDAPPQDPRTPPSRPTETYGPPAPKPEAAAQAPLQDFGAEVLIDERARPLLGKRLRAIRVMQVSSEGIRPAPEDVGVEIARGLRSRIGQPLELRNVTADISSLWYERRIAVRAFVQPARIQQRCWPMTIRTELSHSPAICSAQRPPRRMSPML
jgi:hypothetical protein